MSKEEKRFNSFMYSHKLNKKEIDAMFQLCNVNFSIGKYDIASVFHDMLHYAMQHHNELVLKSLSEAKQKRFQKISEKFSGITNKIERIASFNKAAERISEKIVEEENDLKKLLFENHSVLENALECKLEFIGQEIRPTLLERDKCDLLHKSGNKLFVIELKRDQADHASVTQIDKYMKYFWQTAFNLDHEYVEGVVIAAKYSNYAYENLKKNEIKCFQYQLNNIFELISC